MQSGNIISPMEMVGVGFGGLAFARPGFCPGERGSCVDIQTQSMVGCRCEVIWDYRNSKMSVAARRVVEGGTMLNQEVSFRRNRRNAAFLCFELANE